MADELFEALIQQANEAQQAPAETGMESAPQSGTEAQVDNVGQQVQETQEAGMAQANGEQQAPQENAEQQQQAAPQDAVNYNEWLKNVSGGLFDNEETFKSSLDKFRKYDETVSRVGELEKNQLPDDQFVKQLADMRQKGATKDQISQFIKLNTEYEDFEKLSPQERMVAKLVLVDGYSKDTAERKVSRDFNFSDLDEESDEYKDLKEEQRIASQKDLGELNNYKARLNTVENLEEQRRLDNIALQSAHADNVKKSIPTFIEKLSGLGSFELEGQLGKEAVKSQLSFDYDDDFRKAIPEMVEAYLNDEIAPITQERIEDAHNYIKANYLLNNFDKIAARIYKEALAIGAEKTDNKYVNNTGVNDVTRQDQSKDAKQAQEWADFEETVAKWRV